MVLYLGWADVAFSTMLVEGPDVPLAYRTESSRMKSTYIRIDMN